MEEIITPEESRLLLFFRVLSNAEQDTVITLADRLAGLTDEQRQMVLHHPLSAHTQH